MISVWLIILIHNCRISILKETIKFDFMTYQVSSEYFHLGRPESILGIGYSIPKSGIGIESESRQIRRIQRALFSRKNALILGVFP